MILGIEIRNFDVFDSDKAGILIEDFIEKKDSGKSYNSLRGLNAFIGRNNTGKTSFMGCMAFLKDSITQGCAVASISYGRPGFANMTPDISSPSRFRVFFKLEDKKNGGPRYIQYELSIVTSRYMSPVIDEEKIILVTEKDGERKPVTILEKAATDDALDYINAACEALASKDEISPKALQEFAMQMFAFGVSSGASVAMLDRFSEMKDYLSFE